MKYQVSQDCSDSNTSSSFVCVGKARRINYRLLSVVVVTLCMSGVALIVSVVQRTQIQTLKGMEFDTFMKSSFLSLQHCCLSAIKPKGVSKLVRITLNEMQRFQICCLPLTSESKSLHSCMSPICLSPYNPIRLTVR